MQSHDSIQLAKLFIALKETQDRINNEILPLAACLWAVDDEGLFQTLELAQSAIGQYLKSWRLVAQETRTLYGDDERETYGEFLLAEGKR